MCMQIISEAVDVVISHRCMLSEMHFTCCNQGNKKENKPSFFTASWQKKKPPHYDEKCYMEWFLQKEKSKKIMAFMTVH